MIGPMIGMSSPIPAMIARRTAKRPKIGSTYEPQDRQADERREADDRTEHELAADPLAEDLVDDPDDRPGVRAPGARQGTIGRPVWSLARSLSRKNSQAGRIR